jgi:hypothetical protein
MTTSKFFKTNQQFSKAVEPRKAPLYNPSSCLELWVLAPHFDFFSSLPNTRDILSLNTLIKRGISCIPFIRTQMLSPANFSSWTFYHDAIQCIRQQFHVVLLCSSHDEGQRDATTVDEYTSLAAIFFPDQLGCDRLLQVQVALCSYRHRYFATARQCLPCRRIQQDQLSTTSRKILLSAIRENTGESHWGYQILFWTRLSTVYQYAAHRQLQQRRSSGELVSFPLPDPGGICGDALVFYWVLMVQLLPKTRLKSPMNTIDVLQFYSWIKYHICQLIVSRLIMDKLLPYIAT